MDSSKLKSRKALLLEQLRAVERRIREAEKPEILDPAAARRLVKIINRRWPALSTVDAVLDVIENGMAK
ncbi:MAG: hypothetical protein ACOY5C_14680 [Pseudomonadota bacterium]|uniref:hypothetical protein n=1 Tax=Thermithiobacillus tepidarius TaxID=929 RepID=UPI0004176ED8|nr:hypothetical protein [Thermithiobacillus tepidarius]